MNVNNNLIEHTLSNIAATNFNDCVTILHSIESNNAGDITKNWFTLLNSKKQPLENLKAYYIPAGSVVRRDTLPNIVIEVSKVIISGLLDTITESNRVILNGRTFRITRIVSNNQFITVLEIEDIAA